MAAAQGPSQQASGSSPIGLELEHAIGFAGGLYDSLHCSPDGEHYYHAAGACVGKLSNCLHLEPSQHRWRPCSAIKLGRYTRSNFSSWTHRHGHGFTNVSQCEFARLRQRLLPGCTHSKQLLNLLEFAGQAAGQWPNWIKFRCSCLGCRG